jgi:hypothetical protein
MKAKDESREHISKWMVAIPTLLTVAFALSMSRLIVAFVPQMAKLPSDIRTRTLEFLMASIVLIIALWIWVLVLVYKKTMRPPISLSEMARRSREGSS